MIKSIIIWLLDRICNMHVWKNSDLCCLMCWFIVCCCRGKRVRVVLFITHWAPTSAWETTRWSDLSNIPSPSKWFNECWWMNQWMMITIYLIIGYVFVLSPACFPVFSTEDNFTLTLGESKGETCCVSCFCSLNWNNKDFASNHKIWFSGYFFPIFSDNMDNTIYQYYVKKYNKTILAFNSVLFLIYIYSYVKD